MSQENKTKLSDYYHFNSAKADFLDINLVDDLPLFVDPLLLWRSPSEEHHAVHATIVKFFEIAIDRVKAGKITEAKKMFYFPEPSNLLGFTRDGHSGRGIGPKVGEAVFIELINDPLILKSGLTALNQLQFMIKNVGPDLISDMTVNIAKPYFIHYTRKECERWNIEMVEVTTPMYFHDEGVWDDVKVKMAKHPVTGEGFLLTPRSIVRRGGVDFTAQQIYKHYLRDIYRDQLLSENRWVGLGKKTKLTWKMVEAKYPYTKGQVIQKLREKPEVLKRIQGEMLQGRLKRSLEIALERQGVHTTNHLLSNEVLNEIAIALSGDLETQELLARVREKSTQAFDGQQFIKTDDEVMRLLDFISKDLVLLLGSFKPEHRGSFLESKGWLRRESYLPVDLMDKSERAELSPRRKVFQLGSIARMVIVFDFEPSGHLAELEMMKHLEKPVIIISHDEKGSSYMTSGIDEGHSYFKRISLSTVGTLEEALRQAVQWGEARIQKSADFNCSKYPWYKDFK